MAAADPIVGVDLGTSNTVVAHAERGGAAQILSDGSGIKIHPSVVSFHPSGGVVVGAPAKQRKVIDPKNTIYSVKRLIGRTFDSVEVRTATERMPYAIKEGPNRLPLIVTRGGEFAVPEISAIVLDHVKNVASSALGTSVSRAVVTVPASFNDAQRSATATAGSIAGLTVVRVLNEPTAAALAYGHAKDLRETIAVYDFGGGTFDITILKLADQVYEVLGTAGNSFLGGDDLDERLVDRMVEQFLAENRVDLRANELSMMRLRAVAEQTKIELTRRSRAIVRVDEIAYGPKGKPLDLQIEIRREEFVAQVADIIDQTFPVCTEALKLANLTIDGIDDVILVGGTTKVPYVRDQVAKFFGKPARTDINAEDAVAAGAALQGALLGSLLATPAVQGAAFDDSEGTFEGETSQDVRAAEPEKTLRPTERPVTRGEHKDVFEERIPAAPTPTGGNVLARVTKPGVPVGSGPKKTAIGIPIQPPPTPAAAGKSSTAPRMPAQRPPAVPTASPQSRTLMIEPAPRLDTNTDIDTSTSVADLSITTMPGSTVIVDPTIDPTIDPMLADEETDFPNIATEKRFADIDLGIDLSPSSTARGFAPQRTTAPMPAPLRQPTQVAAAVAPQPIVVDVTPRGLGIATVAGFCEELIRRNSQVPTERKRTFVTSRDDQDSVRIIVVQGESRRLDSNIVIADLRLDQLPRRPRGETSIEVTFMLDASGILQVSARDAQTGREQRASLDIVGSMAEGDVSASREKLQALRR